MSSFAVAAKGHMPFPNHRTVAEWDMPCSPPKKRHVEWVEPARPVFVRIVKWEPRPVRTDAERLTDAIYGSMHLRQAILREVSNGRA